MPVFSWRDAWDANVCVNLAACGGTELCVLNSTLGWGFPSSFPWGLHAGVQAGNTASLL